MPDQSAIQVGQKFRLKLSKPTAEQLKTFDTDKTVRDALTTSAKAIVFASSCDFNINKNLADTNNKETGLAATSKPTSYNVQIEASSFVHSFSVEETTRFTQQELAKLAISEDVYCAIFGPANLDASGIPQFVAGVELYKILVYIGSVNLGTPSHDLATATVSLQSTSQLHIE